MNKCVSLGIINVFIIVTLSNTVSKTVIMLLVPIVKKIRLVI